MPINSMTGFSTQDFVFKEQFWRWEIKTVNGRGLDVKIRLPEGMEALETMVRGCLKAALQRGSVQVALRRDATDKTTDETGLAELTHLFDRVVAVKAAALKAGVSLAPLTVADVLDTRLMGKAGAQPISVSPGLEDAVRDGLEAAIAALITARQSEGRALFRVLNSAIGRIAFCVGEARRIDKARLLARRENLAASLRRVLTHERDVEAGRLEQELALIAVKADVTEELDRLDAHIQAARTLLNDDGPVGRRLEFLAQEFNRETNTLCAKAQYTELTRVGLDLKVAIDQLREQSLNVE